MDFGFRAELVIGPDRRLGPGMTAVVVTSVQRTPSVAGTSF